MPKIMPKAKLGDHVFLAQFNPPHPPSPPPPIPLVPPPTIPLVPLPPPTLISTTNKVTFARN